MFTYCRCGDASCLVHGYADVVVSKVDDDSGKYLLIEQTTVFSATVLGLNVDRRVSATFHVDPDTGQYTYFAVHLKSDDMDLRSEVVVDGDSALCTSILSDDTRRVTLPPGVVLSNSMFLTHVTRDLVDLGAEQQDYLTLDPNNPDVPLQTVFRGAMPFLAALVIAAIILVAFPQLSLWLPGLMAD